MPSLGWLRPEPKHLARLRYSGPPASSILAGVEPADSADATPLVQIINQGPLGSCVANAIAQIIRAEQIRTGAPPPVEFLSRLWAYTLALAKDGWFGQDVGTHLCTTMDILAKYGFPPESEWPYAIGDFGKKPTANAWNAAHDQRANATLAYHQITETGAGRILAVRQALTIGRLVAFGSLVTEAYCANQLERVVRRPSLTDRIAGGHGQAWCAFDRDPQTSRLRFKTVNSWGTGWGEGGFSWWDEDYVTWEETDDLWIISKAPQYTGRPIV